MTYKEARQYLQPIADSAEIPGYAAALEKAIEALEEKEGLKTFYLLERHYCKACQKMHCRVVETEGYFTREEAEAVIRCH